MTVWSHSWHHCWVVDNKCFLPKQNWIHYTTFWSRLRIIEIVARQWTMGFRHTYRGLFPCGSKKFSCFPEYPHWLLFSGHHSAFHGGEYIQGKKWNTDLCLMCRLRTSGAQPPHSIKHNPCALTWRKCILCAQFLLWFHLIATGNGCYFPKQHWLVGVYNGGSLCSLWVRTNLYVLGRVNLCLRHLNLMQIHKVIKCWMEELCKACTKYGNILKAFSSGWAFEKYRHYSLLHRYIKWL